MKNKKYSAPKKNAFSLSLVRVLLSSCPGEYLMEGYKTALENFSLLFFRH